MSEPGRESIPTSADPRSHRPVKKRALTPVSQQAASVDALFAKPDKPIELPPAADAAGRQLPPPPEIVTNVQGSSAGAGSGEFHVYKAGRRREMERLRVMQEEVDREAGDKEWESKRSEARKKDDIKTGKNRRKREKAKARKEQAKGGGSGAGAASEKRSLRPMEVKAVGSGPGLECERPDNVGVVEEAGVIIHDDD
jgi:Protein of unknown function (DUF1168)